MEEVVITPEITLEAPEIKDTFDYGDSIEEVILAEEEPLEITEEEPIEKIEQELEEIEYEGSKHRVPKEIKEAIMRHADYTRKTQEVAEHRKSVEAERESLANQAKAQQENIQEYATLVSINQRVQQFDQVNWDQLNETDPVTAQKYWIERSRLLELQNSIASNLNQKEMQQAREKELKTLEFQQKDAKDRKECFDVVAREIKGWSNEMGAALTKTGINFGFSDEELTKVKDPRFVKLLHKAHIAEQLMKKQASPEAKTQPKPVPQVGANSAPVRKQPEKMSMDEYATWRRSQRK